MLLLFFKRIYSNLITKDLLFCENIVINILLVLLGLLKNAAVRGCIVFVFMFFFKQWANDNGCHILKQIPSDSLSVIVYLGVYAPTLWQRGHLPVCSGSMLIRCCSFPGCEGHGNGSSRSCVPEKRPPRSGPAHCASAARSGGMSKGSALSNMKNTYGQCCIF